MMKKYHQFYLKYIPQEMFYESIHTLVYIIIIYYNNYLLLRDFFQYKVLNFLNFSFLYLR